MENKKSKQNLASDWRTPAGKFQQYAPLVATIDHVLNQISGRGLLKDPPPFRTDRSRRNQNKYCNFHKDVGHDNKDYIQLQDQIENLVHEGHLCKFVEQILTPARHYPNQTSQNNKPPRSPPPPRVRGNDAANHEGPKNVVTTIFGGTATNDTSSN